MIRQVYLSVMGIMVIFLASLMIGHAQKVNDHTRPSVDASTALRQPAFEEMPVYRLQLKLTTGTTNDAGTDDPVYVQMNSSDEKFYLVKGIDNFVAGKTETYEVLIDSIKKVKDIDFIRFGIKGDDGVCLKKMEVILNEHLVFSKEYAGNKGTCIDNGSSEHPATVRINGTELRASTKWNYSGARNTMWRPPTGITNVWLQRMIEAAIGNQIYQEGGSVKWGTVGGSLENRTLWGAAVEIDRINGNTLHVDLDLEADINGPNPEVDVDFDLKLTCENGTVKTEVTNAKVTTDVVGTVMNKIVPLVASSIGAGIGFVAGGLLGGGGIVVPVTAAATGFKYGGKVANALVGYRFSNINNPNINQGCTRVVVGNNGNIALR
jgi:hypothetical protein